MANILKGLRQLQNVLVGDPSYWIDDPILGQGLDAQRLKQGHLACPHDSSPFWFVNINVNRSRLECFCAKCGFEIPIILPSTLVLSEEEGGAFGCVVHPNSHACVIANDGVICVGCRNCSTEIRLQVIEQPILYTAH